MCQSVEKETRIWMLGPEIQKKHFSAFGGKEIQIF